MGFLVYSILACTAIVLTLSVFVIRQAMHNRELERLLNHANTQLEQLQTHFGRFTPGEVIEHLTEPDGKFAARMRSVTVLFADLKDFTKMCDNRDPAEIVTILNGYFQCMSEALVDHHGQVTELMGDGMLALFGALTSNPWQVQDAVMGALAMREALNKYNEELRVRSLPELSFGIGIHQGEVLAGVMGNYELSKFGVVGDAINVASRVEALTRELDADLLITEEVRTQLDNRFVLKKMPAVKIKGKKDPIVTYTVEG